MRVSQALPRIGTTCKGCHETEHKSVRHSLGIGVEVMMVGLLPAFFAAHVGFNFSARKNEPIVSRLVGAVFILVHFQNLSGVVELALFSGATVGLDLA